MSPKPKRNADGFELGTAQSGNGFGHDFSLNAHPSALNFPFRMIAVRVREEVFAYGEGRVTCGVVRLLKC